MGAKLGYLKQDKRECIKGRRVWFKNAWRVVDDRGNDLLQSWFDTRQKATETAKALGIKIVKDGA